MTNQQTQCVIERREAVRFGNDSCIRQHSLGVFFFLFVFFRTEPENGAVDIQLQIQQEGLLLLARHRASEGLVEKRSGVARHSMARHGTAQHRQCFVLFCLHMGM